MTAEIVTAVLAFVGAGVGSVLGYLATRANTRQEGERGRREEWGRRFTTALEALTSDDVRRREIGRTLLVQLLSSTLASDDDRATAAALLTTAAVYSRRADRDLRVAVPPGELDDSVVVEDDESSDTEEGEDS